MHRSVDSSLGSTNFAKYTTESVLKAIIPLISNPGSVSLYMIASDGRVINKSIRVKRNNDKFILYIDFLKFKKEVMVVNLNLSSENLLFYNDYVVNRSIV